MRKHYYYYLLCSVIRHGVDVIAAHHIRYKLLVFLCNHLRDSLTLMTKKKNKIKLVKAEVPFFCVCTPTPLFPLAKDAQLAS